MKKTFLAVLAMLILTITFNLNYNSNASTNIAFADGTCCKEYSSFCGLDGFIFVNYYLKAGSGSCKADPKELTLAP